MLKKEAGEVVAYLKTTEGAVKAAAGVVTVGTAAGVAYFGGKAAVTTACLVGGGIIAAAVTFETARQLLTGLGAGIAWGQRKVEEHKAAAKPDLAGGKVVVAAA